MDIPRDLSNCVNISSNGVGPFASNARSVRVLGSTFNIDSRYEIIEILGSGAYGIVVSARDSKTGQLVAIKKIEKAFDHSEYTKRTLRELKILRLLDNENLLKIFSIQRPNSKEEFAEIYVICELMETDLSSIIKSPQGLSDDHVQLIIYQILRGLNYMHSARILHRDLKPRNVLVNSSCDVKICDFGLARPYTDEQHKQRLAIRHFTSRDRIDTTRFAEALQTRDSAQSRTDRQHRNCLTTTRHPSPYLKGWSFKSIFGSLE